MAIQVFFSNHTEKLLDKLSQDLLESWKEPLNPPSLIIPNQNLAKWIKLQLADLWGIAANIQCQFLESTLWNILSSTFEEIPQKGKKGGKEATKVQLLTGNRLHLLLLETFRRFQTEGFPEELEILKDFLNPQTSSQTSSKPSNTASSKEIPLSLRLSHLLLEYQYNRPSILNSWPNEPFFNKDSKMDTGVETKMEVAQRMLYRMIFGSRGILEQYNKQTGIQHITLPLLYHTIKTQANFPKYLSKHSKQRLYLFGTSELSLFHRQVLYELGELENFHISLYMLNPCSTYWEDSFPIRHTAENNTNWQTPAPPSHPDETSISMDAEELPSMDPSLETHLLSSWGKVGRESVTLWSHATDYNFEYSVSPNSFSPLFSPLNTPNPSEKKEQPHSTLDSLSFLPLLQESVLYRSSLEDVLEERNFSKESVFEQEEKKNSVQIWEAPSIQREVEAVHQAIRNLMTSVTTAPLNLTDIAILVPNMDKYCDTIRLVFEKHSFHSPGYIPFTLSQKVPSKQLFSSFQQAIQTYLNLMQGHLSRKDVFTFLHNPLVQSTLKISKNQVQLWEQWTAELNVYKGYSKEHLAKDVEWNPEPYHTWLQGIRRTLLSAISENSWKDYIPAQGSFLGTDGDNLEEIEEFLQILDKLFFDIEELKKLLEHPSTSWSYGIDRWSQNIRQWVSSSQEQYVQKQFFTKLNELKEQDYMQNLEGSGDVERKAIPISKDFLELVQGCLSMTPQGTGPFLTNGVTISTLTPMKPIPFQVIFILGLNEGEFPGNSFPQSLDLRTTKRQIGDIDEKSRNQYLFLEAVLSARQKLILSYINRDSKKDQELQPSSVLLDLENTFHPFSERSLRQTIPLTTHPLFSKEPMQTPQLFDFYPTDIHEWEHWVHSLTQSQKPASHITPDILFQQSTNRANRGNQQADPTFFQTTFRLSDIQRYIQNPMEYYLRQHLKIKSTTQQKNSSQELLGEDPMLFDSPPLEPPFHSQQELYKKFTTQELQQVFNLFPQEPYTLELGKTHFDEHYQNLVFAGSTTSFPYNEIHKQQMWELVQPFCEALGQWQKEFSGYTLITGYSIGDGEFHRNPGDVITPSVTVGDWELHGSLDFLLCPPKEHSIEFPNVALSLQQGTPKLRHTTSSILFYFASVLNSFSSVHPAHNLGSSNSIILERPFTALIHGVEKNQSKSKNANSYTSKFFHSPTYFLSEPQLSNPLSPFYNPFYNSFISTLKHWFSTWCTDVNSSSENSAWYIPYLQAEHFYSQNKKGVEDGWKEFTTKDLLYEIQKQQEGNPLNTFLSTLEEFVPDESALQIVERLSPFASYPEAEEAWTPETFASVLKHSIQSLSSQVTNV